MFRQCTLGQFESMTYNISYASRHVSSCRRSLQRSRARGVAVVSVVDVHAVQPAVVVPHPPLCVFVGEVGEDRVVACVCENVSCGARRRRFSSPCRAVSLLRQTKTISLTTQPSPSVCVFSSCDLGAAAALVRAQADRAISHARHAPIPLTAQHNLV